MKYIHSMLTNILNILNDTILQKLILDYHCEIDFQYRLKGQIVFFYLQIFHFSFVPNHIKLIPIKKHRLQEFNHALATSDF